LKASFNNRCLNCGLDEAQLAVLHRTLSPDHVRPLAKEGTNDLSNIQPLCHGKGGCNNRKHTKWVDYRGGFALEVC
jgi:5-methylcytosine-specific restriction endonuclease McrA